MDIEVNGVWHDIVKIVLNNLNTIDFLIMREINTYFYNITSNIKLYKTFTIKIKNTNIRLLKSINNNKGIKNIMYDCDLGYEFNGECDITKNLINITKLNLSHNNTITDEGVKMLTNITKLNLWNNNLISNNGIKNLINLQSLNIEHNWSITNSGLTGLTNLQSLNLQQNKMITNISFCTKLITLNLAWNKKITDNELSNLINLTSLNLNGNYVITNEGLKNLSNLKILYLINNNTIIKDNINKNIKIVT